MLWYLLYFIILFDGCVRFSVQKCRKYSGIANHSQNKILQYLQPRLSKDLFQHWWCRRRWQNRETRQNVHSWRRKRRDKHWVATVDHFRILKFVGFTFLISSLLFYVFYAFTAMPVSSDTSSNSRMTLFMIEFTLTVQNLKEIFLNK